MSDKDHHKGEREVGMAKRGARQPRKSDIIIGASNWIKELFGRIDMVAPSDIAVAISGESGTGKELVARTLHNLSSRRRGAFVVVNCAAITETLLEDELFGHVRGAFTDANHDRPGLFAAADGGTLFLDEVGEMSMALQAKLLRVLQEQEFRRVGADVATKVDIRLITATNRNLEEEVRCGRFREDLYYRICVFPLPMLPLRERPEDIPLLAQHFLIKHRDKAGRGAVQGFDAEALQALSRYTFPGNIRELDNKVHQALVLSTGERIGVGDLSLQGALVAAGSVSPPLDLDRPFRELKREQVDRFERTYTEALLRAHHGNVAAAARQAGVDRKNLWAMAKRHNISPDSFRKPRT